MRKIEPVKTISIFFALVVSGLVGCDFHIDKDTGLKDLGSSPLSFATVKAQVLGPSCITCHGPTRAAKGIRLDDYNSVIAVIADIKRVTLDGGAPKMPLNGTLPGAQAALLASWIDAGAPEFPDLPSIGPSPVPSTEPSPLPLQPTFASIKKNIFEAKCIFCHSPGDHGGAEAYLMDSAAALIQNPEGLVVPGDPDNSGLIGAITRDDGGPDDDRRMPPKRLGFPRLSDEEVTAIRTWIQQGANP